MNEGRGSILAPDPSPPAPQVSVTVLDGCATHLDELGLELIQRTVCRLAELRIHLPFRALVPEGPHFLYDAGAQLFRGRRGRGPLRILVDTNIILDLVDQGDELWRGCPDADNEYGEELEALQILLAVWAMRDVRLYPPSTYPLDSRKPLARRQRTARANAVRDFSLALHLAQDDCAEIDAKLESEVPLMRTVMSKVPTGADKAVVRQALLADVHVLLTRDKGIRRIGPWARALGLNVLSPQELLEPLAAAGGLHCLMDPACAYWPMPDQHRVSHLARIASMIADGRH